MTGGRRDALALGATLAVLAVLYALTLCPTVWWYDSGEFAARAASLRSAHAPGYPSYVLVAHLFAQLGPEPAWGTNLMSACFALGSAAAAYVLSRLLGVREAFASVVALALGVSPVLWANAVVTEVYAAGLCCTLACLCLLVAGQSPARWRLLPLAAALAGFGFGLHLSLATCGLGFVLLAAAAGLGARGETPSSASGLARVFTLTDARRRLKIAAWCLLGLAIGLSVYVVFPLLTFEDVLSRSAWRGWGQLITGRVFQNKFVEDTAKTNFGQRNLDIMILQLGWPYLIAAALGLVAAARRWPLCAAALALAAGGNVWTFWNYKVHDAEVFFLPAAAIGFVLVGVAIETAATWIEARLERRGLVTLALALAAAIAPAARVPETYADVDMSDATAARDYAEMLIRELPPDALFVTYNHPEEWRYHGVLQYVKQALGQRPDVRVKTRPKLDELAEQLDAGADVFVFCDVGRVRRRVEFEPDGPLLRVTGVVSQR